MIIEKSEAFGQKPPIFSSWWLLTLILTFVKKAGLAEAYGVDYKMGSYVEEKSSCALLGYDKVDW